MKIASEILDVLGNCRIDGSVVYLPNQLERSIYNGVKKCLENIGGKWNRKAQGFVYDCDPTNHFDSLIITGETESMKELFQFFPTPRPVAEKMCELADLNSESRILEPSCGNGRLMDVIHEHGPAELFGIELNEDMAPMLKDKPYRTQTGIDFLTYDDGSTWNRIIMNPPFSHQQDIDHVLHAYEILACGGILVAVMTEGSFYRSNKKTVSFREFLDDTAADIVDLMSGAFKDSGTMVKTRIVKIVK